MLGGQNLQEVTWVTPTTGGTRAPRDSLTCCHHGLPWASWLPDIISAPGSAWKHAEVAEGLQWFFSTDMRAVWYPVGTVPTAHPWAALLLLSPGAPTVSARVWVQLPETHKFHHNPGAWLWLLVALPLSPGPAAPAGHSPSEEDALGGIC